MKWVSLAIAVATLCALHGRADAGPFGIEMGEKIDQLDVVKQLNKDVFKIKPPQSHPAFDTYSVTVTHEAGVCEISAATPIFDNDAYGTEARQTFDQIRDQLASSYGKSRFIDKVDPNSTWLAPGDWTMSLKQKERIYAASWGKKSGAKLKDHIIAITLGVHGLDHDANFIQLAYEFDNRASCKAENEKALGDIL